MGKRKGVSRWDVEPSQSTNSDALQINNGNLAVTDAENASILGPQFKQVYTKHRKIDWTLLNDIQQRMTMVELDTKITWEEFKKAVTELANGKSPGLNEVPPDAFKSLLEQNLSLLLDFLNAFCNEETNFDEWHEGQVITIPKNGDLSNPNKWRGVTLMDLSSKIFSSILCT